MWSKIGIPIWSPNLNNSSDEEPTGDIDSSDDNDNNDESSYSWTSEEQEQVKAQKIAQQATKQQDKGTQNGTKKTVSFAKQGARSIYNAITK